MLHNIYPSFFISKSYKKSTLHRILYSLSIIMVIKAGARRKYTVGSISVSYLPYCVIYRFNSRQSTTSPSTCFQPKIPLRMVTCNVQPTATCLSMGT